MCRLLYQCNELTTYIGGEDMSNVKNVVYYSNDAKLSKHLMPVSFGTDNIITKYRLFNEGDVTPQCVVSTCSHQIVYIGYALQNSYFGLSKYNTITNTMTPIGTISWSNMGQQYPGGLLVDEKYYYVSSISNASIRVFDQTDLSLVGAYQYSSNTSFQSYGKMIWYDDHTICLVYDKGFVLFDTNTFTYEFKGQSTSYSYMTDFAVGDRLVMADCYSDSNVFVYRKNDTENPFFITQRHSSARPVTCYENGLFYLIDNVGVDIFNEETEEFYSTQITGLWGTSMNPRSACVSNGNLFITFCNSNKVYIMDTKSSTPVYQRYLLSQFTIPNWDNQRTFIPAISKNVFYNSYITMMSIDFSGEYKYNCGYKYDNFSVLFNSNNARDFTYDPRFISFTDSYMTMVDGVMELTLEDYDQSNHIKKVSVNKNDYGLMKGLNIIGEEEPGDEDPPT